MTSILARTGPGAPPLASLIRQAVAETAPVQPVYDIQTMDERIRMTLGPRRFSVTLIGVFAAVALALAEFVHGERSLKF